MPTTPARRFTVLDALVLIAASAVAFAWARSIDPEIADVSLKPPYNLETLGYLLPLLWSTPFVGTMAVLLLRLRGPRPGIRRLARQPGFAACCAAVVVAACQILPALVVSLTEWSLDGWPRWQPGGRLSLWEKLTVDGFWTSNALGLAVATAWTMLALGRRWRPEPSWIDRLGRVLGCYWILMIPLYVLHRFVAQLMYRG